MAVAKTSKMLMTMWWFVKIVNQLKLEMLTIILDQNFDFRILEKTTRIQGKDGNKHKFSSDKRRYKVKQ